MKPKYTPGSIIQDNRYYETMVITDWFYDIYNNCIIYEVICIDWILRNDDNIHSVNISNISMCYEDNIVYNATDNLVIKYIINMYKDLEYYRKSIAKMEYYINNTDKWINK